MFIIKIKKFVFQVWRVIYWTGLVLLLIVSLFALIYINENRTQTQLLECIDSQNIKTEGEQIYDVSVQVVMKDGEFASVVCKTDIQEGALLPP